MAGHARWRWLPVAAALLVAAVAQAFTLRYGGDRDFPPFESIGADGQAQGFQIELLGELAQAGGFTLSIELTHWPQVEAGLRNGRFDAIAMVDVPARREWALFTHSYATPALAIYRLATRAAPQTLRALDGQTVALQDAEPMRDTRNAVLAGIDGRFIELPTPLAVLQAVASGQATYALLPRAFGDRLVASGVVPGVVAGDFSLRLQPYALAVAPGNVGLRDRLDQALAALEASGRLEALRVKWLSSHRSQAERLQAQAQRERERRAVLAAGAAGIALLGLLAWQLRRRSALARGETARRRAAEAALGEAQAMLERSYVRHPQSMLVSDFGSGVVRDVNEALCRLLGATPQQLLGRPLTELSALADPANLDQLRRMLEQDGSLEAVPLQVWHRDGSLRQCLVSSELMTVGQASEVFSILRDVTDELAANAELRAAYEAASGRSSAFAAELRAERMRRSEAEASVASYAALASFELKAPLRNLRGFVGVLQDNLDAGRFEQARSNARQIDLAAQRMELRVGALAQLAELDRVMPSRHDIDMAAMARSMSNAVLASRAAAKVDLAIAALPHARADPHLVAQLWKHLLDNAIKFSMGTDGARVKVEACEEAGRCWYRVSDNGAGFDAQRASQLFQPFQRMHAAREFEGLGIGLCLAQRIVRRHEGEIRLRSQAGLGTVVEFTLDPLPA